MLAAPLLSQHTFSIHFARHEKIRRDANVIEDALNEACQGGYGSPQLYPIPDEFTPEVPRIQFNAASGFSKIAISQTTIALTVNYSEDWQKDRIKCINYLKSRADVLFKLLSVMKVSPRFLGIGTKFTILSKENSTEEVIRPISSFISEKIDLKGANEISFRFSLSDDEKYFKNANVSSFSYWSSDNVSSGHFPRTERVGTGIEVTGDFNNRLEYNESGKAEVSLATSLEMIDKEAEFSYSLARMFGSENV